jgi:hypothetical protein
MRTCVLQIDDPVTIRIGGATVAARVRALNARLVPAGVHLIDDAVLIGIPRRAPVACWIGVRRARLGRTSVLNVDNAVRVGIGQIRAAVSLGLQWPGWPRLLIAHVILVHHAVRIEIGGGRQRGRRRRGRLFNGRQPLKRREHPKPG